MVFGSKKIKIRRYRLTYKNNPGKKRIRVAFLTDLHNRTKGEEGERLMDLLVKCRPDLVLVGGDVLVGKPGKGIEEAAAFIRRLSERYTVYYANGNHEQRICLYPEIYGDMGEKYHKALEDTRVHRLVNEKAEITLQGKPFTIYGYDPSEKYYRKGLIKKGITEELKQVFGAPSRDSYTILLAHTPRYMEDYLEWGADVTLCGHYHGGVMLLGRRIGAVTPDYHVLSPRCCGIRSKGSSHVIVSAGLGEHTIPLRIHNPRELTILDIQ